MSDEIILVIERKGPAEVGFAAALEQKGFNIKVVSTGRAALTHALALHPALIVLNAASLGSNGLRICNTLRSQLVNIPIIHIFPPKTDATQAKSSHADAWLIMPFTTRKLINRIKRLLPGARKDAIEVGPIRLVPGVRIVEAHGREKRLTPKTASLLAVFLQHPGETLDRVFLMRKVWDTDYVGDTRTLDVHVRWVREAIEPEPALPRYILTVRGVGYRFVPNPSLDGNDSEQS